VSFFAVQKSDLMRLPTKGDLVAIDAEFVCVHPEQSLMTSSGSKQMISEPRNALARLSVINCQTNEVIIDDHVLPMEPVVDYLTRFSGIRKNDLDVNSSPHHLITPHDAYLKVRLLMER
jgi:PAB-dependent poly(A)-specific ribonuclease subunit 2